MGRRNSSTSTEAFRFSGHETFVCRYAWLPKAATAVHRDGAILTAAREEDAMVQLGLGKNMVRSVRFWAEGTGVIQSVENGHEVTAFGRELLIGSEKTAALDAYLEDIQSLWLLHWRLSTNRKFLIFAWDFLMNRFQEPELYASAAFRAFQKVVSQVSPKEISPGSLQQLFDVFIRSYVPSRGHKGEIREDNLDCPLAELDLLRHTGFIKSSLGSTRPEPKFTFCRDEKPEISNQLFAYCLDDFWSNRFQSGGVRELSIPFHIVVNGHGSPGQVFKLPEADIRSRLFAIEALTQNHFRFEESAAIPRIVRNEADQVTPLSSVLSGQIVYA